MAKIDPRKKAPDSTADNDDPFEATGQGADDSPAADTSTDSLEELQTEPGE